MIEEALRYEIMQAVPELTDEIYPTNAPETCIKPYLVYTRIKTDKTKTLEGYANLQALSFMFSIHATKYKDMTAIRGKVENLLLGMPKRSIGKDEEIPIEDVDINNITETWEPNLKVNRGIVDFTIYF